MTMLHRLNPSELNIFEVLCSYTNVVRTEEYKVMVNSEKLIGNNI